MIYLFFYLAVGAVAMVAPLLFQRLEKEADRATASMYRTAWAEHAKWTETVVVEFFVPLAAYLFILIAWPVMFYVKLVDMWKFRHLRSIPDSARALANFDPDALVYFRQRHSARLAGANEESVRRLIQDISHGGAK